MAPDPNTLLLAWLAEGIAAGKRPLVVLVTTEDDVPTRLELRSAPLTALSWAEAATYVLEQTIVQARRCDDGSSALPLVHLEDALRSLQASFLVLGAAEPPTSLIGRA